MTPRLRRTYVARKHQHNVSRYHERRAGEIGGQRRRGACCRQWLVRRPQGFASGFGWISVGWSLSWEMTCGVPQGLVLGPIQENVGYDWVLREKLLPRVTVTRKPRWSRSGGTNGQHPAAHFEIDMVTLVVGSIEMLGLQLVPQNRSPVFSRAEEGAAADVSYARRWNPCRG